MRIFPILAMTGLALVLDIGTAPPPAAAQFLGPHLEAQRYDRLRRHQQRIAQKRQAERALTPHQRTCAKRYRSYNVATDRYTVRPGVTARCKL